MTKIAPYRPVVPFTVASSTIAKVFPGLKTRMATEVFDPGAGEIWPETVTVAKPTYEGAFVLTVRVYEAAATVHAQNTRATIARAQMARAFMSKYVSST